MLNTVHYRLRTTSLIGQFTNAITTYDVYYDSAVGIAYEVELQAPINPMSLTMHPVWRARIVNEVGGRRLEYDILQRIYYQTKQTHQVESSLYNLQADLMQFLSSNQLVAVDNRIIGGRSYPGYRLHTLTIWYDPVQYLPVFRENIDRGNRIVDEFNYIAINTPLSAEVFLLPKPEDAIADFDLYPEAPTLPRFAMVQAAEQPQYGVYVNLLLDEIKRHTILNQWEYGPFSTIKLPWLTNMQVTIYRSISETVFPPLVVVLEVPDQGRAYFFVNYDFLGYVVTGFTQDPYDLTGYERLPITATIRLEEFIPLYASPSPEKDFVINNFIISLQSNDFFIRAFDMGNKNFDMVIKNFSFHENEGYYILNVYGKLYWDSVNMEAMFNYVVSGQLADAYTVPLTVYAVNTLKRLGIYRQVTMPVYTEFPIAPPT